MMVGEQKTSLFSKGSKIDSRVGVGWSTLLEVETKTRWSKTSLFSESKISFFRKFGADLKILVWQQKFSIRLEIILIKSKVKKI